MKYDVDYIIKIFNQIEDDFPVNELTYCGYNIWPYIRLRILNQLNGDLNRDAFNTNDNFNWLGSWFALNKNRNLLKDIWLKSKVLNNKSGFEDFPVKSDTVFLSETFRRNEKINGKSINRIIDPVANLMYEIGKSVTTLEYNNLQIPPQPSAKVYNIQYFLNEADYNLSRSEYLNRLFCVRRNVILNFYDFEKYISKNFPNLFNLNEKHFADRFGHILFYKDAFKKILRRLKPKFFFLVCFYGEIPMAASLACHELNIRSIELQHGQQGDFHPMYTNWTCIPKNSKYELLPDIFWTWGVSSKNRIMKWAKDTLHTAIPGGNAWIDYSNRWINTSNDTFFYLKKLKEKISKKKSILFTLQPVEFCLPEFILETIKETQSEFFWLFRMHPVMKSKKEEILSKLNDFGIINFEIDISSEISLYPLFSFVDFHVTLWSSVAIEAQLFNVKTIIAHEYGYLSMKNYCESNVFGYANTKDDLLQLLKLDFAKKDISIPYIIHDSDYIKTKLSDLFI